MMYNIVLAVFAAAFLSAVAVYLVLSDKLGKRQRRVRARLEKLASDATEERQAAYAILRDDKLSQIPTLDRILSKFRFSKELQRTIDQAGVPLKAGALILGMLSLGGLISLLALTLFHILPLTVVAGLVGLSLPYLYILRKKKKRTEAFESLLPEAIDMMTNALKSGFSLGAALNMVAREIPDPLGIEFAITFEEQNLGVDLSEAMGNMQKRVQSEDLALFTTALVIQKRTGGNLVEILEKIGSTMRERFRLKREVRIFTAQGRFSGFILILLPIAMAVAIFVINPEYLKVLLTERVGNIMLGTAIIMQIAGVWIIKRIVDIRI
jgi:tight adherence protein B